ncbi:MAG: hypothetical protein KatS3mg004_2766 [Bryobacteraceae bacterium]|nr:MAG: hypothetical protein KatS3mg004_2766 [Bryobacteraceae bacterium]
MMLRLPAALVLPAALLAAAPHGRFQQSDWSAPIPLPRGSMLVVGFLGAWERWDDDRRSVRRLALRLRERNVPGLFVETAGNHDRRLVKRLLIESLDYNGDGRISADEASSVALVFYGQSFGGAAAVYLARDLARYGVPVRLTVQVDSVGRRDHIIPANVARALNLYQRDPGPIRGEPVIRAADPSRTLILGNIPFTYRHRQVDMSGYPAIARRIGLAHWKMDNDPAVWAVVEAAILAEISLWLSSASK